MGAAYAANWRQEVFIEYYYVDYNTKCTSFDTTRQPHNYPKTDSWCTTLSNNTDCWASLGGPSKNDHCYTTEDTSNNYIALRRFEEGVGTLYAEFQKGDLNKADINFDDVDYHEHYHT